MTTYQRSKLGRFMLIGGLLGAAVSLFDRATRESVGKGLKATANGGLRLYQTVRTNPAQVTNYVKTTRDNLRMTAREISQDLKEMAEKVNGATKCSKQAYQYALEAGNEVSQIAYKVRHTAGQSLLPGTANAASSNALTSGPSASSSLVNQGQGQTKSKTSASGFGTGNKASSSSAYSGGTFAATASGSGNAGRSTFTSETANRHAAHAATQTDPLTGSGLGASAAADSSSAYDKGSSTSTVSSGNAHRSAATSETANRHAAHAAVQTDRSSD